MEETLESLVNQKEQLTEQLSLIDEKIQIMSSREFNISHTETRDGILINTFINVSNAYQLGEQILVIEVAGDYIDQRSNRKLIDNIKENNPVKKHNIYKDTHYREKGIITIDVYGSNDNPHIYYLNYEKDMEDLPFYYEKSVDVTVRIHKDTLLELLEVIDALLEKQ
jgi:hypothetical protein